MKKVYWIFFLIMIIFCFPLKALADDSEESNPLGFTVEAVAPTTQIDSSKTYFYIKTIPSETQELQVKVVGKSEEPVKIRAYIANAVTTSNGTVNYLPDQTKDTTLKNSIEEIVSIPEDEKEFEIQSGEEKIVSLKVNAPSENYDGIKMGAVYFERVTDTEDSKKAIDQKFSYRIGIILSESDDTYTNSEHLNLLNVKPELLRAQKTVGLTLQNPDPKTISDFSLDVSIINESTGKIVKTKKLRNGMMAPNTNFVFSVEWGVDPIQSGKYIAKVSAKSRYQEWELEKKFEVTQDEARKMNEETVYKLSIPLWVQIASILLGVMAILLIVFLSIRDNKLNKLIKKQRQNKNRKKKGAK